MFYREQIILLILGNLFNFISYFRIWRITKEEVSHGVE